MFGKKKDKTETMRNSLDALNTRLDRLQTDVAGLENHIKEISEYLAGVGSVIDDVELDLGELSSGMERWEKTLQLQTDSVEDLLDTMDSQSRGEMELEQQLSEYKKKEKTLLELICLSRDQLWMVGQRLLGDQAWEDQFRMMNQETEGALRNADLRETGYRGQQVDYELHQVLKAVETDEKEKGNTVAQVYRRGWIYQGKVIRKAQVAVYRAKENEEEGNSAES